jgi:hypothetical protein
VNLPLDESYLKWLYEQIGISKLKNPSRTHWSLARQLFRKEFIWIVPNDDNRVEDGRELRHEFLEVTNTKNPGSEWMGLGCSMLEMLIALSRRLAFLAEGESRDWFWELIENMGIGMARSNDKQYDTHLQAEIDEILDKVIWRTYYKDGTGGLFPLVNPEKDQRKLEIWYQMGSYLAPDV